MSEFVQRSDRSIELPLGCKDLLDLGEVRNWQPGAERKSPKVSTDRLAYVEGFLARLLDSSGGSVLVGISLFQGMAHIHLLPDASLTTPVLFASWNGSTQERAVRNALEEVGLQLATEPVGHWKANRTHKYILPGSSTSAARLIGQVLRTGYGLDDLASVTLWYHEPRNA